MHSCDWMVLRYVRVSIISVLVPVWRLLACVHHTINFSHVRGFSLPSKLLKDLVICIARWGTRPLPQGCSIVSFEYSSITSTSPVHTS